MKNNTCSFLFCFYLCGLALFNLGCSDSSTEPTESVPPEIKIGSYIWMTKNLNVNRFSNGDTIPEAKTEEEWYLAGKYKRPAWCYYNNDPKMGEKYGRMYNYFAVTDRRGLAPRNYYVATEDAWNELITHAGGVNKAGYFLKSKYGWSGNGNGLNEVSFTALPGGWRNFHGEFSSVGNNTFWWMEGGFINGSTLVRMSSLNTEVVFGTASVDSYGGYVRCIKYD